MLDDCQVTHARYSYTWWKIFSILFIFLNILLFITILMGFFNTDENGIDKLFIGSSLIIIALMIGWLLSLLKLNKYSFLIATILTFNPIFWIINGIYLKNRWSDINS